MDPSDLPPNLSAKIHVDEDSGCWLFTGALNSKGYGCITVDSRRMLAHRAAYEALVGPIPEALSIDHLCFVKACCYPGHLEAVSVAENNRRAIARYQVGRRYPACRRGHEFTEDTTGYDSRGHRYCKTCKHLRDREAYLRRRASTDTRTADLPLP